MTVSDALQPKLPLGRTKSRASLRAVNLWELRTFAGPFLNQSLEADRPLPDQISPSINSIRAPESGGESVMIERPDLGDGTGTVNGRFGVQARG